MTDCMIMGSVIKYLNAKSLSDEGPWDKILSTGGSNLCRLSESLTCKSLGTTDGSNKINLASAS